MNSSNIQKIYIFVLTIAVSFLAISCQQAESKIEPGIASSPTEAYKMLYTAVKSKDTEKIKLMMSKTSISFAEGVSQQQNKPVAEIFMNGFTATTFAEQMPEIRDERIKDNYGKVEVFSQKDNRWEDIAFVNEDGGWKLAVGDLFAGTFQEPGKSQSQTEKENANASGEGLIPLDGNINGNFNSGKPAANVANVNTAQVKPEKNAEKEKK